MPRADWLRRSEAREALAKHFDIAQSEIEDEIERRMKLDENPECDKILRMLVNVRSIALEMRSAPR